MFTKDIIWIFWLKCYSFSQCGFAQVSSVQLLSPVWLFVTSLTAACQASLAITNRACSHSWPLSRWYHPTISSSVTLFSSRLQSFPASGSFTVSQFFASGGQSIGVSALASVLPINVQDWFPLDWLVWSPWSPRDFQDLRQHHSSKTSILWCSAFFIVQLSHPYMTTGKTIALTRRAFISKAISLLLVT